MGRDKSMLYIIMEFMAMLIRKIRYKVKKGRDDEWTNGRYW